MCMTTFLPCGSWVPGMHLLTAGTICQCTIVSEVGKMTGLTLYTYPNNKNAWKALIAAEYVGAKIEVLAFEMGKTNKTPEFLKLNFNGKVTHKTPLLMLLDSSKV